MKKNLLLVVAAMAGLFATAQPYHWRLTYDMSLPVGEFSDEYVDAFSWRGIGIDNRWQVGQNVTVGFYTAWHVFYERFPNATIQNESGTITATGTQFRYLNTYIFQPNIHYYFGSDGEINPWVGLGVGTAYNDQYMEIGFYGISWEPWSFSLAPQAGIDIPVAVGTDFTLGVRYNWLMNGEDKATSDYTYLGFNVGFKFTPF